MLRKIRNFFQQMLKRIVRELLKLTMLQVGVLFVTMAAIISMILVLIIDFAWDGRFSAEMELAGVVIPTLVGLLAVGLLVALLNDLREEVEQRKLAEEKIRKLNEELEVKVQERTQQLLNAQEELVRKEKLATLGQIAGSVGHELRNPLGVMNNAVYYLRTVLADADDTTKEYLGIIENEIAGSERIVSDLLDSVRTKPPQPQLIGPAELIRISLGKCKMPENIKVNIQTGTQLLLKVDPMQVEQVFINLIKNAADAMSDGGALEITAKEEDKTIKFIFKDTGTGIAPENIAKLFTPLFTTKARGIGLGLVVIKNLTQANGGSVDVSSEPGKGTTFVVSLPIADEKSEASI